MQIWIWNALVTACNHLEDLWNPPLLRAVIGYHWDKGSRSQDRAKLGRKGGKEWTKTVLWRYHWQAFSVLDHKRSERVLGSDNIRIWHTRLHTHILLIHPTPTLHYTYTPTHHTPSPYTHTHTPPHTHPHPPTHTPTNPHIHPHTHPHPHPPPPPPHTHTHPIHTHPFIRK